MILSFEVPKSVVEDLRASAVTERQLSMDTSLTGRPLRVDIKKAPDQFGLRPEQVKDLESKIIPGSGQEGLK